MQISTSELLKALSAAGSYDEFIKQNKDFMLEQSISEHLNELLNEKGLVKSDVIKKSELNENYAFQIFSGIKKMPSRDKLLCLAIGMKLSLEETDGLLKLAGYLPLYPKNTRDSIIFFGMANKKNICQINELLFEKNEETLG